jgi:hypothetical protein
MQVFVRILASHQSFFIDNTLAIDEIKLVQEKARLFSQNSGFTMYEKANSPAFG